MKRNTFSERSRAVMVVALFFGLLFHHGSPRAAITIRSFSSKGMVFPGAGSPVKVGAVVCAGKKERGDLGGFRARIWYSDTLARKKLTLLRAEPVWFLGKPCKKLSRTVKLPGNVLRGRRFLHLSVGRGVTHVWSASAIKITGRPKIEARVTTLKRRRNGSSTLITFAVTVTNRGPSRRDGWSIVSIQAYDSGASGGVRLGQVKVGPLGSGESWSRAGGKLFSSVLPSSLGENPRIRVRVTAWTRPTRCRPLDWAAVLADSGRNLRRR